MTKSELIYSKAIEIVDNFFLHEGMSDEEVIDNNNVFSMTWEIACRIKEARMNALKNYIVKLLRDNKKKGMQIQIDDGYVGVDYEDEEMDFSFYAEYDEWEKNLEVMVIRREAIN